jgi:hypothetical protein
MEMGQIRQRRWTWVIATAFVASVSLSSAAPLGAASPQAPAGNPAPGTCRLARPPVQPAMPLELNTIARDGLFKTIAMEKEVFECANATGAMTIIRDVETFIEIVEKNRGTLVEMTVAVATCDKDFESGNVSCGTQNLPLRPVQTPLKGCNPTDSQGLQPSDPVEMNTVTTIGTDRREYVKTIKVEKEILSCGNILGDHYLFTEIVESRANIPGTQTVTYRPLVRQFFGVFCRKNPVKGAIVACGSFRPLPRG